MCRHAVLAIMKSEPIPKMSISRKNNKPAIQWTDPARVSFMIAGIASAATTSVQKTAIATGAEPTWTKHTLSTTLKAMMRAKTACRAGDGPVAVDDVA